MQLAHRLHTVVSVSENGLNNQYNTNPYNTECEIIGTINKVTMTTGIWTLPEFIPVRIVWPDFNLNHVHEVYIYRVQRNIININEQTFI